MVETEEHHTLLKNGRAKNDGQCRDAFSDTVRRF